MLQEDVEEYKSGDAITVFAGVHIYCIMLNLRNSVEIL